MPADIISDAELEVLNVLWQNDAKGMFLSEIIKELKNQKKEWESSTIRTFLARLYEKKIISVSKKGRFNFYKPTMSKKEFRNSETNFLIKDFFDGNAKKLIASLLEDQQVSSDDWDDLKAFWDKGKRDL